MSVDSAIERFRQRQQDVFRDTARIERPSTTTTLDDTTGVETPDPATTLHTGPCLIRGMAWEGTDVQSGGIEVRLRRYKIKFAAEVPAEVNDIVTPIASIYDPSLVGRHLRVTDVARDGWQISRWLVCEEVTGDV